MPFTPLHLGVGALGKAVLGRRLSFTVFAGAQIIMDLEPGIKMLADLDGPLHGVTHTWPGALVLALVTVLLYQAWLRYGPQGYVQRVGRATLPVVIGTTLFATISHVTLDAMMHADMALYQELRARLGGDAPVPTAAAICLTSLFVSPLILVVRRWVERIAASGVIPALLSITVRPPSAGE